MNVTAEQILSLVQMQQGTVIKLIIRAMEANEKTERPAKVSISFDIKRDKKNPDILRLVSVAKIREPKSSSTDLSGKTAAEELGRWNVNEEPGQERLPGT
jgi:hypothetical protein